MTAVSIAGNGHKETIMKKSAALILIAISFVCCNPTNKKKTVMEENKNEPAKDETVFIFMFTSS